MSKYKELFSTQGNNPLSKLYVKNAKLVQRVFDDELKSFVVDVQGSSFHVNHISIPVQPKQTLKLTDPVLVLQLYINKGQTHIELETTCFSTETHSKNAVRFICSSNFKQVNQTQLHTQIPFLYDDSLPPSGWFNVVFNLLELDADFHSLERISIGPVCKCRRIWVMKSDVSLEDLPPVMTRNIYQVLKIPNEFHIPDSSEVISDDSSVDKIKNATVHIAFGRRQILSSPEKNTKTKRPNTTAGKSGTKSGNSPQKPKTSAGVRTVALPPKKPLVRAPSKTDINPRSSTSHNNLLITSTKSTLSTDDSHSSSILDQPHKSIVKSPRETPKNPTRSNTAGGVICSQKRVSIVSSGKIIPSNSTKVEDSSQQISITRSTNRKSKTNTSQKKLFETRTTASSIQKSVAIEDEIEEENLDDVIDEDDEEQNVKLDLGNRSYDPSRYNVRKPSFIESDVGDMDTYRESRQQLHSEDEIEEEIEEHESDGEEVEEENTETYRPYTRQEKPLEYMKTNDTQTFRSSPKTSPKHMNTSGASGPMSSRTSIPMQKSTSTNSPRKVDHSTVSTTSHSSVYSKHSTDTPFNLEQLEDEDIVNIDGMGDDMPIIQHSNDYSDDEDSGDEGNTYRSRVSRASSNSPDLRRTKSYSRQSSTSNRSDSDASDDEGSMSDDEEGEYDDEEEDGEYDDDGEYEDENDNNDQNEPDDEVELMYDPLLNLYFNPQSGKYYAHKQ
jgi:hypothetical protein